MSKQSKEYLAIADKYIRDGKFLAARGYIRFVASGLPANHPAKPKLNNAMAALNVRISGRQVQL